MTISSKFHLHLLGMLQVFVISFKVPVSVGQRPFSSFEVPFRAAYLTSLTIQMVMILMMPMLAFWSPKEVPMSGAPRAGALGTGRGLERPCSVRSDARSPDRSFLLLIARPGAPSSVLAMLGCCHWVFRF